MCIVCLIGMRACMPGEDDLVSLQSLCCIYVTKPNHLCCLLGEQIVLVQMNTVDGTAPFFHIQSNNGCHCLPV